MSTLRTVLDTLYIVLLALELDPVNELASSLLTRANYSTNPRLEQVCTFD